MLRRVTWRSWAVPGALFAVYIVLGLTWTPPGDVLTWIYKVGLIGATLSPLLLIGIYSATAAWWENAVGTALVQLALSIVIITGPLAWAIAFRNGEIIGGMLAWMEIAGPVLVTLAILRVCWVFVGIHRAGNGS